MYVKSRLASNECFPWPRVDLSASVPGKFIVVDTIVGWTFVPLPVVVMVGITTFWTEEGFVSSKENTTSVPGKRVPWTVRDTLPLVPLFSNGGQPVHTSGDKSMGLRGGQNFLGPVGESGHLVDAYWTSTYENWARDTYDPVFVYYESIKRDYCFCFLLNR